MMAKTYKGIFTYFYIKLVRACSSVFGRGTVPQTGRSWVRLPLRLLEFSVDLILPEISTNVSSWG
jgi:hypothetical protein